jgi:hypothetical protein
MCNRLFNPQTFQLNLANLAEDEGKHIRSTCLLKSNIIFLELSTLGIYPQLNKQAFIRDIVDIINKELHMVCLFILFLFRFNFHSF